MGALDEHDDLIDGNAVTAHRVRARDLLTEIAQEVKRALAEQAIDTRVFFLIPSSGDSVLIFGTHADPDPDDASWSRVAEVVGSIVAQSIGLDRVRCREVVCVTTDSIADQSPVQPTGQSGCRPAPVPAPALQQVGADR